MKSPVGARMGFDFIPWALHAVLPGQYLPPRSASELRGEPRLLLAVLESAVDDVQKYGRWRNRTAGRLAADALEWIESPDTAPYSFQHACEVLGLDPSYIRAGVRAGLPLALEPEPVEVAPEPAPGPPPEPPKWTPQRLLDLRKRLGWTQTRMGEELGITQSNVGVHERLNRVKVPARFHATLDALEAGPA